MQVLRIRAMMPIQPEFDLWWFFQLRPYVCNMCKSFFLFSSSTLCLYLASYNKPNLFFFAIQTGRGLHEDLLTTKWKHFCLNEYAFPMKEAGAYPRSRNPSNAARSRSGRVYLEIDGKNIIFLFSPHPQDPGEW
jgi:hypothetical protein